MPAHDAVLHVAEALVAIELPQLPWPRRVGHCPQDLPWNHSGLMEQSEADTVNRAPHIPVSPQCSTACCRAAAHQPDEACHNAVKPNISINKPCALSHLLGIAAVCDGRHKDELIFVLDNLLKENRLLCFLRSELHPAVGQGGVRSAD